MKTEASGFLISLNLYPTTGRRTTEYCLCFGPERKYVSSRVIIIWITIGYARFFGLLFPEDGSIARLRNTSPNT